MKKLLFGLCFLVCQLNAQVIYPPATQAQVDAGVSGTTFVSPKTLGNWSGGGGGGPSLTTVTNIANGQSTSVKLIHGGLEQAVVNVTYPVETAASNAVAGDTVVISGPVITTNGIWLKPGVSLEGRGNALIINQNSNVLAVTPSQRFAVVVSRNNVVKNLTVTNVYHTLYTCFSVGVDSSSHYAWSPTPTNIVIENVRSPNSLSDGFFFRATNAMTGIALNNCMAGAKYDTIVFANGFSDGTTIPFQASVDGFNAYLFPSAVNLGFTRQSCITVNGDMVGTLLVKNSRLTATNNLSTADCISVITTAEETGNLAIKVDNSILSGTNYLEGADGGPTTVDFTDCRITGALINSGTPLVITYNTLLNSGATFASLTNQHNIAYDATTWNGKLEVPTMDAVRDKIESMGGGTSPIKYTDNNTMMDWSGDFATGTAQFALWVVSDDNTTPTSLIVGQNDNLILRNWNHNALLSFNHDDSITLTGGSIANGVLQVNSGTVTTIGQGAISAGSAMKTEGDSSDGTSIVEGAGAGTGGSASIAGSSAGGTITIVTGLTPAVNDVIATVTYGVSYGGNTAVVLWPANAATSILTFLPFTDGSSTGFTINAAAAVGLTGSTTYKYNYVVVGNF